MIPTIGRIVIFKTSDHDLLRSGGSNVPAIVTRVWSDTCVNLTVFRDGGDTFAVTSVEFAEDHAASGFGASWSWPPRGQA